MTFKRLSSLLILFVLAGCYQQAPDAFEPVNSVADAQLVAPTETIAPEAQTVETTQEVTAEVIVPEQTEAITPTEDVMPFMPTETPTEALLLPPTETPTLTPTVTEVVLIVIPSETPTTDPFALPTNTLEALLSAFTETPTPTLTATTDPFAVPTNTLEPLFSASTATSTATATPTPSATSTATSTATPTIVIVEVVATATTPPTATPITAQQAGSPSPQPQGQTQGQGGGGTSGTVITPRPPVQMAFPSITPDINRGDGTFGGVQTLIPSSALVTPTALVIEEERCFYVVRGGDTLFRISQNNNVRLNDLLSANQLNNQSIIQPGQRLRLPLEGCTNTGSTTTGTSSATRSPATPAPLVTSTPLPSGTTSYEVQAGDTLAQIARRFNTTVEAIVQANTLVDPNRLSIGQTLVIPTGGR